MSTAPSTAIQGRSQTMKSTGSSSPNNDMKNTQKRTTLTQSKLDDSTFRLSKPPKIRSTITPQSETYEKYSVRYFRDHPEEDDDLRDPKEKLMEIDGLITDDVEGDELFNLLVKQKCLRTMVYGESSQQVVNSHVAIGNYYQNTERPKSAIRHFQNGRQIAKNTEVTNESKAELLVGLAESHFELKESGKKNVSAAEAALSEAKTLDIDKSTIKFRRDYLAAKIARYNHEDNACDLYITAEKTMVDGCLDDENIETAEFYLEAAHTAFDAQNVEAANKFAKEASKRFNSLGNSEKQSEAESLIQVHEEEEEHKEEQASGENNDQHLENNEKLSEDLNPDEKDINSKSEDDQEEEQNHEERPSSLAIGSVIKDRVDDEM